MCIFVHVPSGRRLEDCQIGRFDSGAHGMSHTIVATVSQPAPRACNLQSSLFRVPVSGKDLTVDVVAS